MKSRNYAGIEGLRALADRLDASLTKPMLVGQDWWVTATLSDGSQYDGETREVNAWLQGIAHERGIDPGQLELVERARIEAEAYAARAAAKEKYLSIKGEQS